jgi:phospholipase D1/2
MVSPFVSSLRRKLVREHLGLLHPDKPSDITTNSHPLPATNDYDWNTKEDLQVQDPLSPQFWQLLTSTAEKNTLIFRYVFHSVPDDTGTPTPHLSSPNLCGQVLTLISAHE